MLTVIQVGHDAASDRYIRSKKNAVEQAGMTVEIVSLPKEATTDDVQQAITDAACLTEDCCAILVQLPLPEHIDRERVLKWIPKTMDIDGLNPAAADALRNHALAAGKRSAPAGQERGALRQIGAGGEAAGADADGRGRDGDGMREPDEREIQADGVLRRGYYHIRRGEGRRGDG